MLLEVCQTEGDTGCYIARCPVLAQIKLLRYVQERSVCIDYHRYGNLVSRAGDNVPRYYRHHFCSSRSGSKSSAKGRIGIGTCTISHSVRRYSVYNER